MGAFGQFFERKGLRLILGAFGQFFESKGEIFLMNRILIQLEKYMFDSLKLKAPHVRKNDLEKDGAIFYMNGKNGTEFDWFVNDHFSDFFIFYKDEENLGAVKAMLYKNGDLLVYVYGDNGHSEPERLEYEVEAKEKDLLHLAVALKKNADDKRIWDEDIRLIENGMRSEPTREGDSGWYFCVGDEDDDYVNNPENLELWLVNSALMRDPALEEFITAPYGTAIIRVSPDKFEIDKMDKEIFIAHR